MQNRINITRTKEDVSSETREKLSNKTLKVVTKTVSGKVWVAYIR